MDKASAYYARKKDFGKAALSALYQGYAEKDYDKVLAMDAFKDAERYGELIGDSLTMARAEYQMGKMLYNDYMYDDALMLFHGKVQRGMAWKKTFRGCVIVLRIRPPADLHGGTSGQQNPHQGSVCLC